MDPEGHLELFETAVCGIGLTTNNIPCISYVCSHKRENVDSTRWMMAALPSRWRVGVVRGSLEKKLDAFLVVAMSVQNDVSTSSIQKYSTCIHGTTATITLNHRRNLITEGLCAKRIETCSYSADCMHPVTNE